MITSGPPEKCRQTLLFGVVVFVLASTALAQAWLPPKGEASFGVAYANIYTRDHLFSEGERYDGGRILSAMVWRAENSRPGSK